MASLCLVAQHQEVKPVFRQHLVWESGMNEENICPNCRLLPIPGKPRCMITHLEPDILEYEVKWTLGSITTNKASGGDRIPAELFQTLEDDALKCCTQCASNFGKLISGHRTGKDQFSFQSQSRAMPESVQTTTQLHSFHMLAKQCSKFSRTSFFHG